MTIWYGFAFNRVRWDAADQRLAAPRQPCADGQRVPRRHVGPRPSVMIAAPLPHGRSQPVQPAGPGFGLLMGGETAHRKDVATGTLLA